jgi:hypothetical protein
MPDVFAEFASLFDDLTPEERASLNGAADALAYARGRLKWTAERLSESETPAPLKRLADLAAGLRSEAAFEAVVVRVGATLYAVPKAHVVDRLECGPGSATPIERVKGASMIRDGERLAPVLGLPDIFNGAVRAAAAVVLVEAAGRIVGIACDGDVDEVEAVARDLPDGLAATAEVAGAAVLPDGAVALIPDLDAWAAPGDGRRGRRAA